MTKQVSGTSPLFVCGCPRSGTSAVADWFAQSGNYVLGMERYQKYWREHHAFPDQAFEFERFFEVQTGDTWYDSLERFPEYYARLRAQWDGAVFIGDKIPRLWEDFDGLYRQFPDARVVFTFRDPFAVARSYKQRSKNPKDLWWGGHRDASFGILEFNECAGRLVDFFNSVGGGDKRNPHDRCFILKYEEFMVNSLDRRTLSAFLGHDVEFRLAGSVAQDSARQESQLTEVERDLLWELLDTRLLAEVRDILSSQNMHFRRKASISAKPGRREWYHTVDRRDANIDYGDYKIPGCNYVFRGREEPIDTSRPYAAVLGSATSFGRFLKRPYPMQLEDAVGMPFINLGIAGARPETYLCNESLMNFMRGASLIVIEAMSARGYPFPLYAPVDEATNMGRFMDAFGLAKYAHEDKKLEWLLGQAAAQKNVFVDRVYEIAFKYLTSTQREIIRDVIVSRYISDMKRLIREIGKPVAVLLMTRNKPYQARQVIAPENSLQWTGDYPHFIDEVAMQSIRQQGIPVVESRSQRGFPYVVRNWETGEPAAVYPWQRDPSLNTYYPSQEMHDDAVQELLKCQLITGQ